MVRDGHHSVAGWIGKGIRVRAISPWRRREERGLTEGAAPPVKQPGILGLPLPRAPRSIIAVKQILCKVSLNIYGKYPMYR
jgi:hypothetical protein